MPSISDTLLACASVGVSAELPRAGTVLENPFVYDSVARDIKREADHGHVEIVSERLTRAGAEVLIEHLAFRRLR